MPEIKPPTALPVYAAGFLLGMLTLFYLPGLPDGYLFALLFMPLLRRLSRPVVRNTLVLTVSGFIWAACQVDDMQQRMLPHSVVGKDILLQGNIVGLPQQHAHASRFFFRVEHDAMTTHGLLTIDGLVRVSDYTKHGQDDAGRTYLPGQSWQLLLRLRPLHGFASAGAFDHEKWLFQQGVIATAYIRASDSLNRRLPQRDWQMPVQQHRLAISAHIQQRLSDSSTRGLISALATGDRRHMDKPTWQVLRDTGTSHLMAISGLHVGLVATLAYWLFLHGWSTVPRLPLLYPAHKAAAVAGLLTATGYSLLAGFSLPTQRALLMLALFALALLLGRRVRPVHVLSLCLMLLLLLDPLILLSSGFWLSFGAVAVIFYLLQTRYPQQGRLRIFRMQLGVSLLLAPLTLLLFDDVSLVSPLANVIAIPVVGFVVVPLVLCGSLLYLLAGPGLLEGACLYLADQVMQALWWLLEQFARAVQVFDFVPAISAYAFAGLIFALLLWMLPGGFPARYLAFGGILLFLLPTQQRLAQGQVELSVLDVGQGLAAVIRTRNHTLLFDTGARFSDELSAGDAVVLPALRSKGVTVLDMMIISDDDNDHMGGAKAVMQGVEIDETVSNVITLSGTVRHCVAGRQWNWDGVVFRILHPEKNSGMQGNNNSCVLHVKSPYGSLLLPADIEKAGERHLLARYADKLQATVLVAPHHGSRTSSTEAFIDAVSPGLVVFPAGWMNRYRHPAAEIRQRFQQRNIPAITTGDCGSVTVLLQDSGIEVSSWRHSRQRLWQPVPLPVNCRQHWIIPAAPD